MLAGGGLLGVFSLVALGEPVASEPATTAPSSSPSAVAPALEVAPQESANPAKSKPDPNRLDLQVTQCAPGDAVGLGPYAEYRDLSIGRIAIPQKGGHTDDLGFDVLIHFHGHDAARRVMAKHSRGVVFVGMDLGLMSGAYRKHFLHRKPFRELFSSIEKALKSHTGDPRAHVRKLGMSSWSAGYGAIERALRFFPEKVDSVILLDSLHSGFVRTGKSDGTAASVDPGYVRGIFAFGARAAKGEKLLVSTNSQIETDGYASTSLTNARLISDLSLTPEQLDPGPDAFGQLLRTERRGFFSWSYAGKNKLAHCAHLHLMPLAVTLMEERWQTPKMSRDVPNTPSPPEPERRREIVELSPLTGPGPLTGGPAPAPAAPKRRPGAELQPGLEEAPPTHGNPTPDPFENTGPAGQDTGGLAPIPLGE